ASRASWSIVHLSPSGRSENQRELIAPVVALASASLPRDLSQDRHRDLLRRDGAEIKAGGRLHAIDCRGRSTFCKELLTQSSPFAAAADESVVGGFRRKGGT